MNTSLNLSSWQDRLLHDASKELEKIIFWKDYLAIHSERMNADVSIHLAVFQPPFLEYILLKRKSVESRFSSVRCAPHGQVKIGDVLLLKKSGGPIIGACTVNHVWFYELNPETLVGLRESFAELLCAQDPEFWAARSTAKYASLMKISNATRINPLNCDKKDRRGWVILESKNQTELVV